MENTGLYHNFKVAPGELFTVPASKFAICTTESGPLHLYYSADGEHFSEFPDKEINEGTTVVLNAPKNMVYRIDGDATEEAMKAVLKDMAIALKEQEIASGDGIIIQY